MHLSSCCQLFSPAAILALICLLGQAVNADEQVAPGPFTDTECLSCHSDRDPGLVAQWRASPHTERSGILCSSCHGSLHTGASRNARREESCIGCHAGSASHSYTTSKHGVINRIEWKQQSWQKPLQRGNYRAPSCSYCHFHNGDHGDTMSPERGPEVGQWICAGCHSPRYVREQFANGRRQLDIFDLKLKQGEHLFALAVDLPSDLLSQLRERLEIHRKNVLYGVGHQSPDYQWWHGQAALDGDLISIRETISKSGDR